MPVIARYTALYPRVQIDFALVSWTLAMHRLHERTVDIAIVTQPETDALLYSLPVTTTRYRAYVCREHPLAGYRQLSLRDLADRDGYRA